MAPPYSTESELLMNPRTSQGGNALTRSVGTLSPHGERFPEQFGDGILLFDTNLKNPGPISRLAKSDSFHYKVQEPVI
jgi:hypothetical protein